MVRHSAFTTMFKLVIALLTALVFVGVGGVTVSAGAHDCGCQEDNSGPGSTDSGSSGSGTSGSSGSSGSSGPDNSGPGNACHDNSGPGSSGPDNSGPGNAEDDCPADEPDNPDDPGDSSDPGNGPSSSNSGGSGGSSAGTGTVVLGAQASAPTQAGAAAVPTAVNAGLIGSEESPSALAILAIMLGLAMTGAALVRRRTRA